MSICNLMMKNGQICSCIISNFTSTPVEQLLDGGYFTAHYCKKYVKII